MEISHLFYVDDAVLLTPWSSKSAKKIVHILRCFYLSSSLRINLHKTKLIEIGVVFSQVKEIVGLVGCAHASLPFVTSIFSRPKILFFD